MQKKNKLIDYIKYFFNILKKEKMIKMTGKTHSLIGKIKFPENKNEEYDNKLIKQLRMIKKAFIGVGIISLAGIFIKKFGKQILGFLATALAGGNTQILAVTNIIFTKKSIDFLGYCLENKKRTPKKNEKFNFYDPFETHIDSISIESVNTILLLLNKYKEYFKKRIFNTSDFENKIKSKYNIEIDNTEKINITNYINNHLDIGFSDFSQDMIWKITDEDRINIFKILSKIKLLSKINVQLSTSKKKVIEIDLEIDEIKLISLIKVLLRNRGIKINSDKEIKSGEAYITSLMADKIKKIEKEKFNSIKKMMKQYHHYIKNIEEDLK